MLARLLLAFALLVAGPAVAQQSISNLPLVATPTDADLLPLDVQSYPLGQRTHSVSAAGLARYLLGKVPLGPQGIPGQTGPIGPATQLSVGSTTTGAAGQPAVVTIAGQAPAQTLNFTIPTGAQGPQGPIGLTGSTGPAGPQGNIGATGVAGPPTTLSIGTVATSAPGGSASASVSGQAPNQAINLTLPQGPIGPQGPPGPVQSVAGRQGAVTLSNTDISGLGTSATRNVGTSTGTVADGSVDPIARAAQATANAAVPQSTVGQPGGVASYGDSRITGAVQAAGGDASGTNVLTPGGTTPRTLAAKAADVYNAGDYGAKCDDVNDDAPAINLALNAIRSAANINSVGSGAYVLGTGARLTLPKGKACKIKSTLNMTNLIGSGFVADLWGAVIDCQTNGTPCIDATGLKLSNILGLNIYGNPTTSPNYGLVLARDTETANGADIIFLDSPTLDGFFTTAAYYNRSSETTHVEHAKFSTKSPNAYAAVFDGSNHFNFQSAFTGQTYTKDVYSSFNENTCMSCVFAATASGSQPIWIGGTNRHILNGYVFGTGGKPGVTLWSTSTTNNSYLDLDLHFEDKSMPSIVQFDGTLAAPTVYGLRMRDNNPGQSGPIFSRASGVTSVAIQNADFQLGYLSGVSPSWWDLPSAFSVSGKIYNQDGTYSAPSIFSGMLCVSALCNSSFTLPSSLQISSITNSGGIGSIVLSRNGEYTAGQATPTITIGAPNNSNGQQAAATVSALGMYSEGTIASGGSGYVVNNIGQVQGGTCSTAPQVKVTAVNGSGTVTAFSWYSGGSCTVFPSAPATISGGAGTGWTTTGLTFAVTGTAIVSPGSGYTTPPPLTFSAGNKATATATATLTSTFQATAGLGGVLLNSAGTTLGSSGTAGGPVVAAGALIDGSGVRQSLGSSYTVPANTSLVRFTQTGAVTSTITLPTALADGQPIQFVNQGTGGTSGAITATFSPAVQGFANGGTIAANTGFRIRWDATAGAWQREQ